MITLNYADLQKMVTNYRTRTAMPLNWSLALTTDIQTWVTDLQNLPCNGFRIYMALADSTVMDAAGKQVFAGNFHGCTVMIAVPTERNAQNDVDDLILNPGTKNETINCISIGWTPNNDNMGMCPPMCAAVISNNAI